MVQENVGRPSGAQQAKFLKFKNLKNCLWITVSEERLAGLALLFTEKEIAFQITVIALHVTREPRKV
jgi:hypothetical protein